MKKLAFLGLVLLALSGCNTIGGVGEDISAGANTVQNIFN
ncbi:MAG: entericidin [Tabrizicola sp.]|nr:entericidin [Tabrizicola sp.]